MNPCLTVLSFRRTTRTEGYTAQSPVVESSPEPFVMTVHTTIMIAVPFRSAAVSPLALVERMSTSRPPPRVRRLRSLPRSKPESSTALVLGCPPLHPWSERTESAT